MAKIEIYNANLCNEQFLFFEMRIVAKLMLEGLTEDEIISKVREENLFQKPTERKLIELSRNCLRRLNCLDNGKTDFREIYCLASRVRRLLLATQKERGKLI